MNKNLISNLWWGNLLEPSETEVRKAFTFKPQFTAAASERLHIVAQQYTERFIKKKKGKKQKKTNITFVGVHLR
jgi:hypothetical protein